VKDARGKAPVHVGAGPRRPRDERPQTLGTLWNHGQLTVEILLTGPPLVERSV